MTNIQFEEGGRHTITAGKTPFEVEVQVRPVGVIQLPERTLSLLSGPFSPEYVPAATTPTSSPTASPPTAHTP